MSALPATTNGHDPRPDGVRTYRGRTIEEILPKIREELGPEAIILREREGLVGGVGGFFAQRFIEIDARRGGPSIDLYDDEDDDDFVRQLEQAAAAWSEEEHEMEAVSGPAPEPDPEPEPEPLPPAAVAQPAPASKKRLGARELSAKLLAAPRGQAPTVQPGATASSESAAIAAELAERGASPAWIAQLLADAAAHRAPLAQDNSLRAAVRGVIARGIAQAPALPVEGAAIAFVGAGGAGKTRCVAALASAYRRGSTLAPLAVASGTADRGRVLGQLLKRDGVAVKAPQSTAAAAKLVNGARIGGMVVLDTAAVSPPDTAGMGMLGAELEHLSVDAIYVTLPATLGSQPARKLLASFGSLRPTAVAITHTDETDQLAVAIEIAWSNRIPVAYVHGGTDLHTALTAPDPVELAHRLLP